MLNLVATILAAEVPTVTPNSDGLPGIASLLRMIGGLATIGFILCTAGVIGGAAAWGLCGATNNPYGTLTAKRTVALSLFGALIIGAASVLIRFFVNAGSSLN
jgi:hypothetical protein